MKKCVYSKGIRGQMEHSVFMTKRGICGYVVISVWFPSLASVDCHNKIKLIDDHILNTTQKRNFSIFEHFDVSIRSHSVVDCWDTVS